MVNQTITDQVTTSASHRAWIADGILYHEYVGELTTSAVLDVELKSIQLLKEQRIQTAPGIVLLKNIDKTNFKLKAADYGKVFAGFDLIKRTSAIWIVGAKDDVKKSISVINKIFFGNRMYLVDTLQEAQDAARTLLSSSEPILEKE